MGIGFWTNPFLVLRKHPDDDYDQRSVVEKMEENLERFKKDNADVEWLDKLCIHCPSSCTSGQDDSVDEIYIGIGLHNPCTATFIPECIQKLQQMLENEKVARYIQEIAYDPLTIYVFATSHYH